MVSSDTSIRAVIFDYGGVLTTPGRAAIEAFTRDERIRPDTFSAALKAWLSRSAPTGTPLHRLETGEIGTEEFNKTLAARLRTEDDQPVAPEGLLTRLLSYMKSDPQMLKLVRDVRDSGARTALLSNSWGNNYPWDTLGELFELAVISSEVGLRKPDPRIYRMMLDRLDLPAGQTVFVDDGTPNIEIADRLGMHTVLHSGTGGGTGGGPDSGPDGESARTRERLAAFLPDLNSDHARRADE